MIQHAQNAERRTQSVIHAECRRSILNRQAREYKVLLHDDAFSDPNWRQHAINVLFQVFEFCTIDNAMQAILVSCRAPFCNYGLSAFYDAVSIAPCQECSFYR